MITSIILGLVFAVMLVFTVGAVFLAHEEKKYRYDVNITDEHEV